MAKRGRPPLSPEQKLARGERRPSRQTVVVPLFPDQADRTDQPTPIKLELPKPPRSMTAGGRRVWIEKVAVYARRGQPVVGFEALLTTYCELEAKLRTAWKSKDGITAAMLTAHRKLAEEFFDTPTSSARAAPRALRSRNAFNNNGRHG
jgi:hypothetical protein